MVYVTCNVYCAGPTVYGLYRVVAVRGEVICNGTYVKPCMLERSEAQAS